MRFVKSTVNQQSKLPVNFMVTNSCSLFSSYKLKKSVAIYIPYFILKIKQKIFLISKMESEQVIIGSD